MPCSTVSGPGKPPGASGVMLKSCVAVTMTSTGGCYEMVIFIIAVLTVIIILLLMQRFTTLQFVSHAKLLFKTWSVWLASLGSMLSAWFSHSRRLPSVRGKRYLTM